jgi:hypothetical protein
MDPIIDLGLLIVAFIGLGYLYRWLMKRAADAEAAEIAYIDRLMQNYCVPGLYVDPQDPQNPEMDVDYQNQ